MIAVITFFVFVIAVAWAGGVVRRQVALEEKVDRQLLLVRRHAIRARMR